MELAALKRKLRELRRLETRHSDGTAPIWDRWFSTRPGAKVRYPITTLSVLDRASRREIFRHYLECVIVGADSDDVSRVVSRSNVRSLCALLGVPEGTAAAELRARFRKAAKELHPDLGGNLDSMIALLRAYEEADLV